MVTYYSSPSRLRWQWSMRYWRVGVRGSRIFIVVSFIHTSLDTRSARLEKIIKKKDEDEDDEKENKMELKEKHR